MSYLNKKNLSISSVTLRYNNKQMIEGYFHCVGMVDMSLAPTITFAAKRGH